MPLESMVKVSVLMAKMVGGDVGVLSAAERVRKVRAEVPISRLDGSRENTVPEIVIVGL